MSLENLHNAIKKQLNSNFENKNIRSFCVLLVLANLRNAIFNGRKTFNLESKNFN